jgi:hypothetical protein
MRQLVLALGLAFALSTVAHAGNGIGLLVAKLGGVLEGFGLGTVLISRGQEIGDVLGLKDQALLARSKTCFPKLAAPIIDHPTIGEIVELESDQATITALVDKVFSTKIEGARFTRFLMRLSDIEIRTVAVADLISALDKGQCAFLLPYLETGEKVTFGGKRVQVVASILKAKRNIALLAGASAGGEFKIEDIRKLLGDKVGEVIPIGVVGNAEFDISGASGVIIRSAEPEVVGFAPSYIPGFFTLGSDPDGEEPPLLKFERTNGAHRSMLKALVDAQVQQLER